MNVKKADEEPKSVTANKTEKLAKRKDKFPKCSGPKPPAINMPARKDKADLEKFPKIE